MPTNWVVTTPSDRIELDEAQHGQTTFTVTNPTGRSDRVTFDIVPRDGADAAWFSIDEPQRRVPAGGSVSYVVTVAIPPTVAPGSYAVQGRVYSSDSAPEENSVTSGRVAVEVKPKPVPVRRRRLPWWAAAVAGLVAVALVVVIVLATGGEKPVPTPSAAPAPSPAVARRVIMPDLSNQSGKQALTNITAFGLATGTVRHVLDKQPDRVVYQSVAPGSRVAAGTPVDLVVTTALAVPTLTAPASLARISKQAVAPSPTPVPTTPSAPGSTAPASPAAQQPGLIRWTDSDGFVRRWQVVISQSLCIHVPISSSYTHCKPTVIFRVWVDHPWFTPWLDASYPAMTWEDATASLLPDFQVTVAAVDDFGNVGPASTSRMFIVG